MKIGLTYHICHEILRQIVPKKPAAPTSFWAKLGKTLKQIENFDQNVHVSNFCGKADVCSQNRALVGRRHFTQEYSVEFSCHSLEHR
jgi:hypothetical protein